VRRLLASLPSLLQSTSTAPRVCLSKQFADVEVSNVAGVTLQAPTRYFNASVVSNAPLEEGKTYDAQELKNSENPRIADLGYREPNHSIAFSIGHVVFRKLPRQKGDPFDVEVMFNSSDRMLEASAHGGATTGP
jgi:hypothetical protein